MVGQELTKNITRTIVPRILTHSRIIWVRSWLIKNDQTLNGKFYAHPTISHFYLVIYIFIYISELYVIANIIIKINVFLFHVIICLVIMFTAKMTQYISWSHECYSNNRVSSSCNDLSNNMFFTSSTSFKFVKKRTKAVKQTIIHWFLFFHCLWYSILAKTKR